MSGDGTHSVRVQTATSDLFCYSDLLWQRRLGRFGRNLLLGYGPRVALLLGFVALLPVSDRLFDADGVPDVIFGVAALWFVLGTAIWLYRPFALHQRYSFLRRPTVYTVSPDGLEWRNDVARGVLRWDDLAAVEETGDLLLFRFDKRAVHIVPKHSFDTPDAAQRFLATARQYWQAARKTA